MKVCCPEGSSGRPLQVAHLHCGDYTCACKRRPITSSKSQPAHSGIANTRAKSCNSYASRLMPSPRQTVKRVTSYTTLGIVRTLIHCCVFVTRPIVHPTPKWRVGFGDSMAIELKPSTIFGALRNAPSCLFYGGCARETLGSAGFSIARFANPRTATTHSFGDD